MSIIFLLPFLGPNFWCPNFAKTWWFQAEGGEKKAPVGQSFVFWGGLAGMIFVPVFSGLTQCPAWRLGDIFLGLPWKSGWKNHEKPMNITFSMNTFSMNPSMCFFWSGKSGDDWSWEWFWGMPLKPFLICFGELVLVEGCKWETGIGWRVDPNELRSGMMLNLGIWAKKIQPDLTGRFKMV